MKAKIYTKSGDRGQTSLVGGTRVSKTDLRLEAYGTLDELNSSIGVIAAHLRAAELGALGSRVRDALVVVQNNLFNIGSHLACEDAQIRTTLPTLSAGAVTILETDMDAWENELPKLNNFILPGGSTQAAYAHLARTVCRRAERATLHIDDVDSEHLIYLNRLSDWLFLLARKFNHVLNHPDVAWRKG